VGKFVRPKRQGYKVAKLVVFGRVGYAHPAPTQLVDNAVRRDGLPRHGVGARLGGMQGQINNRAGQSYSGIESLAFLKNRLPTTILGDMRATSSFNGYPAGPGIRKSGGRKWTAAIFSED